METWWKRCSRLMLTGSPVVDHMSQGAPGPRHPLAERFPAAFEDLCAFNVGESEHVGEQVGGRCGRAMHNSIP